MKFSLGKDEMGAEQLIVKSGCLRSPNKIKDLSFEESGNPISSDHLFMVGTGIFNFTLETVSELVKDTLFMNKLTKDEINQFVVHQANQYMMGFLRKKIQIPEEKFYYYLD